MRVLITGVTGLIGSRLASVLHAHRHEVLGLSRDPERARRLVPALQGAMFWNPLSGPPDTAAFEGVEAVVHLAGESLAGRWTPSRKRAIRDSRLLGTRHLVQGLREAKSSVRVLVAASAVGYYGDQGETELTEHAPPGRGYVPDLVRAWEEEGRAAQGDGLRVVHTRFGLVLCKRGGALKALATVFRLGLGGRLGSGEQWWPWVHLDDAVGFIQKALHDEAVRGVYNLASPRPVRQEEFARTLADILKRPAVIPVGRTLLRIVLGEGGLELLKSQRAVPRRTLESGFRFRYEDLRFALGDALTR